MPDLTTEGKSSTAIKTYHLHYHYHCYLAVLSRAGCPRPSRRENLRKPSRDQLSAAGCADPPEALAKTLAREQPAT